MSYLTLIGCFLLKGYDAITTLSDGFILSIITIAFVVAILLGLKYISGIKYISNKLDKKYWKKGLSAFKRIILSTKVKV
jgi:hypothetical protein